MLYIALEESFRIFRRILTAEGVRDPSFLDAGAYLDRIFNPEMDTGGYFKEYYDTRIKVMHPDSNRFGVFAIAPLEADEYFYLRSSLVAVFDFLITKRILLPQSR